MGARAARLQRGAVHYGNAWPSHAGKGWHQTNLDNRF